MPGLQLVADQSLFIVPVPCCLSLSPLCAVSLSIPRRLQADGPQPQCMAAVPIFFCVSKPVLGDDCSVTYRALDLPGLPDLVGSVSRFRGLFALQHARFVAIEAMERWGSLRPWKGPELIQEPKWSSGECEERSERAFCVLQQ